MNLITKTILSSLKYKFSSSFVSVINQQIIIIILKNFVCQKTYLGDCKKTFQYYRLFKECKVG